MTTYYIANGLLDYNSVHAFAPGDYVSSSHPGFTGWNSAGLLTATTTPPPTPAGGPSGTRFSLFSELPFDMGVIAPLTADGALTVDAVNPVDATAANRTMTLPTGTSQGRFLAAYKTDATTHTVTLSGNIRGNPGSTFVLSLSKEGVQFVSDAAGSWWPVADHKTLASLDARYSPALAVGSLAGRPAANTVISGSIYFATDDNGGKLYKSDGSAWTAMAPGVSEVAAGTDLGFKQITSAFSTTSASMVDVTGLTSMAVTFPASGAILVTVDGQLTQTSSTGRAWYQVQDDIASLSFGSAPFAHVANEQMFTNDRIRRITAAAGTVRTYKVQLEALSGGTAGIGPAVLRAIAN